MKLGYAEADAPEEVDVTPVKRPASYDDLRRLPENVVGEIVGGELFVSPRPSSPHAIASSFVGIDVGGPFGRPPGGGSGPGGWWILDEPELHFGPDVLVPDLAGWRRERMPKVPNVAAFELAPDWVCEVVSPSTERLDRSRKMKVYARAGVAHLWLVNPLARTLEAYALDDSAWKLALTCADQDKARVVPFDAIELDLSRWWLDLETP